MATKTCPVCGNEFTDNSNRPKTFCSPTCRNKSRTRQDTIPCPQCGKPFIPYKVGKRDGTKKYCSRTCANTSRQGFPSTNPNTHTQETRDFIKNHYESMTLEELSNHLNIPPNAISQIAYKMGLKRSAAFLQATQYKQVSQYMRENNPMKRPEVVAKTLEWRAANPDKVESINKALLLGKQKTQKYNPSKTELKMRKILDMLGVTYEPSAVIKDKFIVDIRIGQFILEVDGEYWHGHPRFYPLTERQIKQQKRDRARDKYLTTCGYTVIRIWERDIHTEHIKKLMISIGIIPQ